MSKLFYYDLETTGVNHKENGIHQISGAIEINGELKETFNFKVKPHEGSVIEPKALEVAGVTNEEIESYTPMREVYRQLIKILSKYVDKFNKKDKFHLVGYNNRGFDDPFFREWFTKNGDNYFGSWFWPDSIDVIVLASDNLKDVRSSLENFQLKTVAKYLALLVDETKLHDALYDIELTRGVYKLITK